MGHQLANINVRVVCCLGCVVALRWVIVPARIQVTRIAFETASVSVSPRNNSRRHDHERVVCKAP